MKYYIGAARKGNNILYREVDESGRHFQHSVKFQPSLYTLSPNDANTGFTSMFGEPLVRRKFPSIFDANEFIKRYEHVQGVPIFGNMNYLYQFLAENYPGDTKFNMDHLNIIVIDIETTVERGGKPNPKEAPEEIILITAFNRRTKKYITWGKLPLNMVKAKSFKHDFDIDTIDFEYRHIHDERERLSDFLFWWKNVEADCLTGWNTECFDIPYIVNRIARVIGGDTQSLLSPFGLVKEKEIMVANGATAQAYDLHGVACLDYLALYKKFGTYSSKESYKLDFIAHEVLGVGKLDMGVSFKESYTPEHWDRFVLYNIVDVERVARFEDELALIQLALTIAYDAKCLPQDVFGPVKTWDCLIYRSLMERGIVIHQKRKVHSWEIEGAYVKEPKVGEHKWLASVDAESLYPTIIMQYNMSPETLVEIPMRQVTVDALLMNEVDLSDLPGLGYGMAANGQLFDNKKIGLFPELVGVQFAGRKAYKAEMKKHEKMLERIKIEMDKRGLKHE